MTDVRETEYRAFVERNLRRNYTGHFIHGMLGQTGWRIVFAPTFLPAYLHRLTGSDALVGLGTALLQLGAVLSPLSSAAKLEHQPHMLGHAVRTGVLMRVMLLGLALAGWLLHGPVLLVATMFFLFGLGAFNGVQRVAFQLLLGKVIPIDRRGRLQAWRNLTGGAIAAVLSWGAGVYLIGPDVLGNGYATTIFCAFVLTSLGLSALRLFMVEPAEHALRPPVGLRARLRDVPELLADRDYRRFLLAQGLCVGARIASPFAILFAGERLGLSGRVIGELSLAYLGADTLSNLIWGYLGDRTGYRVTFLGATAVWAAALALLLAASAPGAVLLAFGGLGAGAAGYQMSQQTMVLEFGRREDVAMRLALTTTLEGAVSAAGPLVGGALASAVGYSPLFALAIAFLAGSFALMLLGVEEPRRRAVRPEENMNLRSP